MKRYDMDDQGGLEEDPEGELVKWEDVEILFIKMRGLIIKIASIEDGRDE
jgi:hypothetical protein